MSRRRVLFALLAGIGSTLAIGSATALPSVVPQMGGDVDVSLNGVWEGNISFDKETFLAETSTPASGQIFRISIHDEVVHVFFKEPEGLEETMAGIFHIAVVSANAVIYATREAQDGPWVETVTFVVTKKDNDTLLVQFVRVVNNIGMPLSDKNSKFAARGEGEFKRVSS